MSDAPRFSKSAVAAPHSLASQSGQTILREGGNAIEAMIAMAATIAVVYPHMNALGGDGFWLIREANGRTRYIEGCGYAGSKATIDAYRKQGFETIPPRGPLAAVTVPGAIGGWALAHELAGALGGRLPLRDLLNDAQKFAAHGYPVSRSQAKAKPFEYDALKAAPGFAKTYLVDGEAPKEGTIQKNEALGAMLDHLSSAGLDDFYRGDIASEMAQDCEKLGTPITRDDLNAFRAVWREPLSLKLKGRTHYNSAPPTQGLASLIILGLYERLNVKQVDTFEHIHALIESTKRAFAIRDAFCTDFDRLKHAPDRFLDADFLDKQAARISMSRAATLPLDAATGDTIWMGAIDANGLAVSYIQSIYWEYGSGCVLPRTGVLLQNRGVSFSLEAKALNPLEPRRRPFHTLNPALCAFDDGRVLSYGSMGGDGQPQFQSQIFTRIHAGQSLAKAIDGPRFLFGRTWGQTNAGLKFEPRFDDSLLRALRNAGHEPELVAEPYAESFGHAGALMRHTNGAIDAAHDPRSDGGAMGI